MTAGRKIFSFLAGLLLPVLTAAQQDPSLFLLYQVPESNLMNPAVPLACPWYIGIPVLSSVHANHGNSLFTYNQLFRKSPEGSRTLAIEQTVASMHRRDFFGTEAHVQLLAFGHKTENFSLIFTITEKNNLPLTLPAQGVKLLWNGNRPFEGQHAGLNGTSAYFTHYREYALSVSRRTSSGIYWGGRVKLLFGKLNLSVSRDKLDVFTDERTFDLQFDGRFRINSSLPVIVRTTGGRLDEIIPDEHVTPRQLIFNGRNPGFAMDAGVIYPCNDRLTLSASVLDFGFIWWRSYLNNMAGSGTFTFRGTGDLPQETGGYFTDLVNTLVDSMHLRYVQERYVTPLPLHILAGGDYALHENLSAGLVAEMYLYRTKARTAVTVTGQYHPLEYLSLLVSYTLQDHSFNNVGAGLVVGRDPVQFYILSTTVPGLIRPLNARSLNVRFGLNILLGCREKKNGNNRSGGGVGGAATVGRSGVLRPEKSAAAGKRKSKGSYGAAKCHDGLPAKEKAYKKKIKKKGG